MPTCIPRLFLHAAALVVLTVSLMVSRAQVQAAPEPTPETLAAADQVNLDPVDLQGASNTTGLDPVSYLFATGALQPPAPTPPTAPVVGAPFGLSPYLARVAACESVQFRPDVVYGPTRGKLGEIGLFQLHPQGLLPTFYAQGFTDPWDPWQQAAFATWAFAHGLASRWSCA